MACVLQPWVTDLSMMQQTVLLTAIRGCDGIAKKHKAKPLIKWYRRCVLYSAFDKRVLINPFEPGGGSFTGPITDERQREGLDTLSRHTLLLQQVQDDFIDSRDELPMHYQMHMMHAFEIIGYKHPNMTIRMFWHELYNRMVYAFHLWPETKEQLDARLGDNEAGWRARNDCSSTCSD